MGMGGILKAKKIVIAAIGKNQRPPYRVILRSPQVPTVL